MDLLGGDAFALQHRHDGHPEDAEVEHGGAVGDVPVVELDPLGPGDLGAALHLGPAGDPGEDVEAGMAVEVEVVEVGGRAGRGPTIAIWPRSTLTRFGTSSKEVRRISPPERVTRGSPSPTTVPTPTGSEPCRIVRSFSISNSRPSLPTRSWR